MSDKKEKRGFRFYQETRGTLYFYVEAESFEEAEALIDSGSVCEDEHDWHYDGSLECDDEEGEEL